MTAAQAPGPGSEPVWLLTGSRLGEIAQLRRLAQAVGLPWREIQVARQKPVAGRAEFDFGALRPPWPALALSFGQTLPAALRVRRASRGQTRIVHLGRPGGWVRSAELDLVIPMPQDGIAPAANVLAIRMPFNWPQPPDGETDPWSRALAGLPRPTTLLILGGPTRQLRVNGADLHDVVRRVNQRVGQRGGSLLVSTSPRTPPDAVPALRAAIDVPGVFYSFMHEDPRNPFSAFLQHADEIVVTGDSASMVAECWRTGKPLSVIPLRYSSALRWQRRYLGWLAPVVRGLGRVPARFDVNGWLAQLARDGDIGVFDRSEPRRGYAVERDDDLERAAERIRALMPGRGDRALPSAGPG